jgi:hypothetical protein
MTAAGMSVAITVLSRPSEPSLTFGSFLVILSGAFAALLGEREAIGRFTWEPGIPRRLFTLCIAAPLFLLFSHLALDSARRDLKGSIIALIVATAFVDWRRRARRDRETRIDLGLAFRAGLAGLGASFIFNGGVCDTWAFVPGSLAAMSLAVNARAAFEPRRPGQRFPTGPPGAGGGPFLDGREMAAAWSPAPPAASPAPAPAGAAAPYAAPYAADPTVPAARRPLANWARVIWLGLSAALLASGIALLIAAGTSRRWDDQLGFGTIALMCLGYCPIAFHVGSAPLWVGGWRLVRWCLIAACLVSAASSGTFLSLGQHGGDETITAIVVLTFSLVFALFLKLLPGKLARIQGRRDRDDPPGGSPGWTALGAILVTLGISVALASAFAASGLGRPLVKAFPDLEGFYRSGMHLFAACALFVPGIFCILRARSGLGAAHVFRGAVGFSTAALLIFLLAGMIPHKITEAGGRIQFDSIDGPELTWLFALGILSALFLFWPAKTAARIEIR